MSYQFISFFREDPILILNILGCQPSQERIVQLSKELFDISEDVKRDKKIQVIVVTDCGANSFDMEQDMRNFYIKDNNNNCLKFYSISDPIAGIKQPTIVAVTGNALAQGLELVLACDIRIAAKASVFGFPQIKEGLFPLDGGTQRLARLVGKGMALEMILTGKKIDVQEAYRIGLVNKIVPKEEVMESAMNIAREIASKAPIAARYAKEAVYKGMDMTIEQGLHLEADLYFLIHTTKDRIEGINAFQKKRNPKFKGK